MLPSRISVMISFFIHGFLQANLIARFPGLMEQFSWDNKTLGLALFGVALGAVLFMPLTGWLASRNGEKKISAVAIIFYCMLFPLVPLMVDASRVVAIFFVIGIASGMTNVCNNAQGILVEREMGRPIMTSFHALFSIGVFIGAASGSMFIKLDIDLFTHLLVLSLTSIAVICFAVPCFKDTGSGKHNGPFFKMPGLSILTIGVVMFCAVIGESTMSEWSPNYMVKVVHASEVLAPWGLSAFALAMTIGRIFGDRARLKLNDGKLMVICSGVAIVGMTLSILFYHPAIVLIGFFMVGLGLSIIIPVAYSVASSTQNVPPPIAVAMVATVGYTAFLCGSPIIGVLADWHSLRLAMGFVVLCFFVMGCLSIYYVSQSKAS